DKANLEKKLKEAESGWEKDKEELAAKDKDIEVLWADVDKYHSQWKDQMLEEIRLKAIIRNNRTRRAELKKSLEAHMADVDTQEINKYVKTEKYTNAIGLLCYQWYGFGFELARKQAEAALGKVGKLEILNSLDATKADAISQDVVPRPIFIRLVRVVYFMRRSVSSLTDRVGLGKMACDVHFIDFKFIYEILRFFF
ncbi:hypothetical protein Dimus_013429, partial [Dionaea muscipula]